MKVGRSLLLVTAIVTSATRLAFAHHGKDFLLVESYDVPEPGDFYLISSAGILVQQGEAALELEPALLVGVLPRVAVELHGHVDKEPDEPLRYESTAPSLHVQITPPDSKFPVNVGLSAEYELASSSEVNDRLETRLIGETDIGATKLVGNLIVEHERGGDTTPGYAIGARYSLNEQFACGVEAQGPFTRTDNHELLFGVYAEPTTRLTLKGGLGAVFSDQPAGFVARLGVVLRL